jgi:peptidyl-prolyl cis-trans isomerase D
MIEFVRRRKKGLVNFILLGLAVILMISFGLDSFLVKGPQEEFAIKIDGQQITQSEYQRKLRSMEQLYSAQLKGMFEQIKASLNLPQKIADQMIEERLLSRFLKDLGFSASHFQVEERIAQLPYFGGKIDQQSYVGYLQASGMSEGALIDSITREVVEGELNRAFAQLAPLSEDELKEVFKKQLLQAKFISAKFKPQDKGPEVSQADIEKYYNDHKAEFNLPKEVKFEYALLSPKKFLDKVPVAEDDLKQLYQERSGQFMEPEKLLLSKISFIKVEEPAKDSLESAVSPNEKKQQLAQSIIERVKKGEDFGQLAREFSEDKESKEKGGEIGWKKTAELNEDLKASLADVAVGTTTGIVEDANEFAVYFVAQRQDEKQLPYEAVKDQLTKELKAADAPMYLEIEGEKLYSELQSSKDKLEDFAKRQGLEYKVENSINKQSLGIPKALRDDVIDSEQDALRMTSTTDGVYFYKVIKTTDEHPKPLADAKEEIKSKLQEIQSKVAAKVRAEKFLKSQLAEKSVDAFKKAILEAGGEVVESGLETQESQKSEFISSSEDISALYALSTDKPVYDKLLQSGNDYYVVQLAEKKEPNGEEYSKKRIEILAAQSQKSGARILDSLVAALRAESKIEINPDILTEGI